MPKKNPTQHLALRTTGRREKAQPLSCRDPQARAGTTEHSATGRLSYDVVTQSPRAAPSRGVRSLAPQLPDNQFHVAVFLPQFPPL